LNQAQRRPAEFASTHIETHSRRIINLELLIFGKEVCCNCRTIYVSPKEVIFVSSKPRNSIQVFKSFICLLLPESTLKEQTLLTTTSTKSITQEQTQQNDNRISPKGSENSLGAKLYMFPWQTSFSSSASGRETDTHL